MFLVGSIRSILHSYCYLDFGRKTTTSHIMIIIIDKIQQGSTCRLYGDRYETINHVIRECSKLALKENKTKQDWARKVIHKELCNKFD